MQNTRIAIIGAGTMCLEHLKVFSIKENVTIEGIHSRTRSKAEKLATEFNITHICNSIPELFEKTNANLVIIAVPELQANLVAKIAFKYPWKILMEKPVGYNLKDAKEILDEAKQQDAYVMVGLNRRFYSSVQIAIQDLLTCNDKRFIHIQDQQNAEEARYHKHPEEVVKNFMYANSIHNIDLIRVFARGNITRVQPVQPWQGEQTEVVLSYIEFDSGDSALYEGLWQGPGPWGCSISTKSRRWVLQPLETVTKQILGERKQNPIETDTKDKQFKPGFYKQASEVLKAVRNQPNQVITLQESFRTMQLIHDIFQAKTIFYKSKDNLVKNELINTPI